MFKGRANKDATAAFLERQGVHPTQKREFCGVNVASLALGTYLGNLDDVTDAKVTAATQQAIDLGCNFFDSAINYRSQRGERSIGEGLRRAFLSNKAKREELFISTKGGFLPGDARPVTNPRALFEQEFVATGIARREDLIADCHCMEPAYLADQLEKSRKNLGVETIDLYYIHNPETQLEELPERIFYDKLEKAFAMLEGAITDGKIASYGLATWNAFREEKTSTTSVQLERCMEAARKAAATQGRAEPGFKAIQLPLNLAMPEAALVKTQRVGTAELSAIDAAKTLGLSVAVSVPLFQARLCHGLPEFIVEKFPKDLSQAQCALAFATSFASVDAAMVGMKHFDHVAHNLAFLKRRTLDADELGEVISAMIA